jgi:hypothetical protein
MLAALQPFVAANPDATQEEIVAFIMGLGVSQEDALEAMELMAAQFRAVNKNPDMTFEEMKEQVASLNQLPIIDIDPEDVPN